MTSTDTKPNYRDAIMKAKTSAEPESTRSLVVDQTHAQQYPQHNKYTQHNNTRSFVQHNNTRYNNAPQYQQHNNAPQYQQHNNAPQYQQHNNVPPYQQHNNAPPYQPHNKTQQRNIHMRHQTYNQPIQSQIPQPIQLQIPQPIQSRIPQPQIHPNKEEQTTMQQLHLPSPSQWNMTKAKDTPIAKIHHGDEHGNDHEHEHEHEPQDIGDTSYLHSQWTVWVHRNDCPDWTLKGFKDIYVINSWGSFYRFFNNFHLINKEENQFFIFRDKIKPYWEDNNNRNGGKCSIKLDCYDKHNSTDIACSIMMCLSMLLMNETLISDNNELNGITYAIKNRSAIIKIWSKDFNNKIDSKLSTALTSRFISVIKKYSSFKKFEAPYNIKYTEIEPEEEVTET